LLGVRTFDSDVSGKLGVGREIDMVLVETHAGKFFCKLLEFIRDKKRFQRYDPAFISGMNRINKTNKKLQPESLPGKTDWGECQVCIWSSSQNPTFARLVWQNEAAQILHYHFSLKLQK